MLGNELNPQEDLLNPSVNYLKTVAQGLLYKVMILKIIQYFVKIINKYIFLFQFVLNILGSKVGPNIQSGALNLKRGLSSGKQDFDTDEKEWPIYKPTIKVEAMAQCSGIFGYFV